MHQALWLLTQLQLGAALRKVKRSMKTVRGVLMLLFVLGFFGMMILPGLMASGQGGLPSFANAIRDYGPFALLAYVLFVVFTSLGEGAINFSPSEVDLLFPAPFTRRQLLMYKIFNNMVGLVLVSLFIGAVNRLQYNLWVPGIIGTFLTLAFLQLCAMFSALLQQTAAQAAHTRTRRVIVVVIIAALAFAAAKTLSKQNGADWSDIAKVAEIADGINESTIGGTVLAPFRAFCNAITARTYFPEFALWSAIGLAINIGLLLAIFRLDANFNEAAVRISQKKYDRVRRLQTGSLALKNKGKSTWIPMIPYLGGIGPLLWRQLVRMVRATKSVAIIFGIICVSFAGPFLIGGGKLDDKAPGLVLGVLGYASFLVLVSLPAGFRVDATRIEVFKSLPVPSWSICIGELAGPACMVTLVHWAILLVLTLVMPGSRLYWTAAAACSPLLNLLLLSVSNGLFLLFPVQVKVGSTPDLQTGARNMITFLMQGIVIGLALLVVALPSGLVYFLSDSITATALVATFFLICVVALAVLFVCFAYDRFDVSKHLPS